MTKVKEVLGKSKTFFLKDLWQMDLSELSRGRLLGVRQLQLGYLVVRNFLEHGCMLRASALTYTTLLAIVPLLALMFALLKGFGVQNALEPIILEHIAVGSEEVITAIIRYINNTNVGRLGGVGLAFLFVTVLALLSNIEKSFNHIWDVAETRSIFRRFSDYFSVVAISPILLLAAISMTTTLKSQAIVQGLLNTAYVGQGVLLLFKTIPFIAMWAAFTFLLYFMPNTRVKIRSALVGGILGGTLWQVAQWGYVNFQVGVAKYNAIYGTMAALPIFIVWLYLSWMIVLLGVEVSFASQNLHTLYLESRTGRVSFATRQRVALALLLLVSESFYRGEQPKSRQSLAMLLEVPQRFVNRVLSDLVRLGLLSEVALEEEEDMGFLPARDPHSLELSQVIDILRRDGMEIDLQMTPSVGGNVLGDLESRLQRAQLQSLEGLTVSDLVKDIVGAEKDATGGPPLRD